MFKAVDGLSGEDVGKIFEDREGNVWVVTLNGLDRFREYPIPTISRNQGLSNSRTWSVQATPDGSIWVGTADGLNRWANGHVTAYGGRSALVQKTRRASETEPNAGAIATEIASSGLAGIPQSLGLDDTGRLWASTNDGVFYFERGKFVQVPGVPGGLTFSIASDGHGDVWILQPPAGVFDWSGKAAVRQISLSQFAQKTARTMLPDREPGGLWLGFLEGGIVHLKDGKVVRSYGTADGLNGRVNQVRFGWLGAVLAATEGGLSRIKDGHIETLNSKNGLSCDEVHWSMEDDDHDVWVYMPCGLVRIERSEWYTWANDPRHVIKTAIFDLSDGVRSVGVYGSFGPHMTKSPDGRVWFASRDGVSVIDPRHLPFNKLPPPVHIEQITANGKTYDATSDTNGSVRLPPLLRDLEIDYTALSLVAPEKVFFRYKLDGWDRDWQVVGTRRQAFYSNLPPRRYVFRVIACNNSGVWNDVGASLAFSVAPAFYQTTWFRLSCVAASLMLLYALYRLRLLQLARQFNIRLEERVNERTRIARDLHDTLLQSFQGVMMKLYAVTFMVLDRPTEARKILENIVEQAGQAIAEGRDTVQGMRSSTVIKNDLACALTMVGERFAAEQNFQSPVGFRVVVEGESRDLHPILRDEVYRIASEATRNAFRHSDARQIEVEIYYDDRQLRVRVLDNGKGIDPNVLDGGGREGHYGLPGMQERAKLAGGKLTVRSRRDSGTEIELTIPASLAYVKSSTPRQSVS